MDDINVNITPITIKVAIKQTAINVSLLQQGPKGDGPITSAYVDGSGDLHVVSVQGDFNAGYVVGPQGVQGIQGLQGRQGPTGATGAQGIWAWWR